MKKINLNLTIEKKTEFIDKRRDKMILHKNIAVHRLFQMLGIYYYGILKYRWKKGISFDPNFIKTRISFISSHFEKVTMN